MVEVSPKTGEIRIHAWRYLAVLLCLLLVAFLLLWILLGSQWGASNPYAELARKYLSLLNNFRPSAKPEDNLANALRIHRVERMTGKKYALLFSVTDANGDPIKNLAQKAVTIGVGDPGQSPQTVVVDRLTSLKDMSQWNSKLAFSAVMDYSGSMFPEDLKSIEENYSSFIKGITFPFSAGVIKFNSTVNELLPMCPSLIDIEANIKKSIKLGNTALYSGMDKGLESVRPLEHMRFLLLTTDGNDNVGGVTLEEVIKNSRQAFVSTFVLGFGWLKIEILRKIADETDGYYVYVPDSSDLNAKFLKLAEIVNYVQVAEFISPIDVQPSSSIKLVVDTPGGLLTRTR